ncbi:MAG: DMT family transporter [Candidatus Wallbacteria bacterium]|nr:DMT family transporter [Candidatus Wallbacteria bacterium]
MTEQLIWLTPTIAALGLYGVAQGLVKLYISEVPSARYCLYFFVAKAAVLGGYWARDGFPAPVTGGELAPLAVGTLAYVLEGLGWICYYESIVSGPITIVGTLSAAYAAPTVILAYVFLGETLFAAQYAGVAAVILGCVGLSWAPPDPEAKVTSNRWIPLAFTALAFWGSWQTIVKYCFKTYQTPDSLMALYNIFGAFLTLGVYGLAFGRGGPRVPGEWRRSALPMAMMAGGDLGVIVGTAKGPVSMVTAISGAYPLVTLVFASIVLRERITRLQWFCLLLILGGMFAGNAPAEWWGPVAGP